MLKIRLARFGKKHAPSYRIVVAPARSKRSYHIDTIGFYNPSHTPTLLEIDQEKFKQWQANGAQISTGLQRVLDEHK